MSDSPYIQLDKFIDEYEEDARTIRSEKLIMVNYPKIYLMMVASLFEKLIKKRCQDFIDYPLQPIPTYINLDTLICQCSRQNKPVVDGIYGKFHTFNRRTNMVDLDATGLYDLFGGASFEANLRTNFNSKLSDRFAKYQGVVDGLFPLIDNGEQYEREYAKNDDIKERLTNCTFYLAEKAFLELKLRRNQVAHDYINGLSDSFGNIRDFYLDAVVYVMALDKSILDLTDLSLLISPS